MKRGDIVLIKYPFTNLVSSKVRPALIISSNSYTKSGEDAIFMFISSQTVNPQPTDLFLDQSDTEFLRTGLKKASLIRTAKIATLSKNLASSHLGQVGPTLMGEIGKKLREVLSLS
jgi:mRNA interferase MazF